jgi:hypothetical protein
MKAYAPEHDWLVSDPVARDLPVEHGAIFTGRLLVPALRRRVPPAPDNVIRQRAARGHRRLTIYPSAPAYSRLKREIKKRRVTANGLLTRILKILGSEDLYAAVLDDQVARGSVVVEERREDLVQPVR